MSTGSAHNAPASSTAAEPLPSTTIVAIQINPVAPGPTDGSGQPTGGILAATSIAPPQYNSYTYYLPPESSTATPSSSPSSSSSSSAGTRIAVGVAIPLVFLALGGGIFFFFRRRRRKVQQQEKKASRQERGYSTAPTHTTFHEKSQLDERSGSPAATLDFNRKQSQASSRSNSRMAIQKFNGIEEPLFSPVSSNMDFDAVSQTGSYRSGSVLDSKSTHRNVSLSSHPSLSNANLRIPGTGPRSPRLNHIGELPSPTDMHFRPENDAIHELGPGKEAEAEANSGHPGSVLEPVVPIVAELPDTSGWGAQDGNGRTPVPVSELPTTRDGDDAARQAPAVVEEEQEVAATELPAPVPASRPATREGRTEGEGEMPEARLSEADDEGNMSWLTSTPNTPTSQRFH